jgi:uncharacterized metal-binding protein YceD (DUF177 family)
VLEYSEIQEGRVVIDAILTKSERLMEMDLNFKGEVIIPCDLCGENFVQEICFDETVVIKTGDNEDEDEGIIILGSEETELNISHYLYESISLSLPSKRVHPQVDGKPRCDKALLAKLNPEKGGDDDEIDPRWAALKKLK